MLRCALIRYVLSGGALCAAMLLAGATGAALGHDTSATGAQEPRSDRGRATAAAPGPTDEPTPRQRGLIYAGLTEAVRGRCAGVFRVDGTSDPVLCTHGPDPAPPGVDVTERRSISELRAEVAASRFAPSDDAGTAAVPCIGDGVSGPRIQAIYAVASNRPDRYASTLPLIRDIAAVMDAEVNQSASETGGERHIQFVTNADCSLDVAHVVLSPTGDDDFGNTIGELISQGYDDAGRKYHVWMDANILCGVGTIYGDDSQGAGNANNSSVSYARSDTGCWDYAELHELFHNLGAVQLSAPHSSGGFHCTDEYDRMCYDDDGAGPVTMTYPCAGANDRLLDCNHDDYFHTSPHAGSYLATHWNTADSVFLTGSQSGGGGPAAPSDVDASATSGTEDPVDLGRRPRRERLSHQMLERCRIHDLREWARGRGDAAHDRWPGAGHGVPLRGLCVQRRGRGMRDPGGRQDPCADRLHADRR